MQEPAPGRLPLSMKLPKPFSPGRDEPREAQKAEQTCPAYDAQDASPGRSSFSPPPLPLCFLENSIPPEGLRSFGHVH